MNPLAATDLRLPGVAVESPRAPLRDDLPRMDVALFVGFAASGPVGVPVAIEQAAEFAEIFGGDLDLAWDLQRGEMVRAELAPAVRAFFRNGGRRCWVVRVAGAVTSSRFPLSRLACWSRAPGLPLTPGDAVARARSGGSWADDLAVASAIERDFLVIDGSGNPATEIHPQSGVDTLSFDLVATTGLETGDVLRLSFADGRVAVGAAMSVTSQQTSDAVRVTLQPVVWLSRAPSIGTCSHVSFVTAHGAVVTRPASAGPADPETDRRAQASVNISAAPDDSLREGQLLRIFGAGGERWLMSGEGFALEDDGSPPPTLRARGPSWRWEPAPAPLAPLERVVERLRLTLIVRRGETEPVRLANLGLSSAHPRYWGRLPDDDELFKPLTDWPPEVLPSAARRAVVPRFPLTGEIRVDDGREELCVPLGDSPFPAFLPAFSSPLTPAERDGLATFAPDLFLDPNLADSGITALAARAAYLRYESAPLQDPQPLHGIHAGFFIEEVSMIAIPDAIHRRWRLHDATDSPLASPPRGPETPPPPCAPEGPFHEAHPCSIAAPVVKVDLHGSIIHLEWPPDPADPDRETIYTVEEAPVVGDTFAEWSIVAKGRQTEIDLYGRGPGEYGYRVTAARHGLTSVASGFQSIFIAPRRRPLVDPSGPPHVELLRLQRALMRMCAARGDCLAVLALPEHYREEEAIAHARDLAVLRADESALSYAAVYHPWLFVAEDTGATARRMPPDGTITGALARRAIERGAWVAPANDPLKGIVALAPRLAPERLLDLQRARINVIRQHPRGFMALNEDTLSRDLELRRINVRRLMTLLRRRAIQVGNRHVFEPNDDAFRRLMQRTFETTLADLHARGAFAGRTASAAFQVVTDARLNTPQARDAGRFFVELKVAPSLPLTFLRIRLVQRGERLQASEER